MFMAGTSAHTAMLGSSCGEFSQRSAAARFAGVTQQMAEVRRFVRRELADHPAADDALLAASELAANAVEHTASGEGGTFTVAVCTCGDLAFLVVADQGSTKVPCFEGVPVNPWDSEHGRGLLTVQMLSLHTGWDALPENAGIYVWCACGNSPAGPLALLVPSALAVFAAVTLSVDSCPAA